VHRHDLDAFALVVGAIFAVFGLGYAIGRWNWFDFGGAWMLAAALITLGVAGVVSASTRRPGREHEPIASDSADDHERVGHPEAGA
jgi:sugar phosphate permease